METFGRRLAILTATLIFIVGSILQTVAPSGNLDYIYAGRALVGLGVGVITAACPIFLYVAAPSTMNLGCVAIWASQTTDKKKI